MSILNNLIVSKAAAATIVGPTSKISTLADIINPALKIFYGIVGVILFGMFLFGGFTWLTSAGDPDKVKKSTGMMINAVIGTAIIIFAFFLTKFIGNLLGFQLI